MRISTARPGRRLAALFLTAGLCFGSAARAGESAPEQAKAILGAAGVTGGLVVHVGCGDGKLTAALRANPRLVVHGLDADVKEARRSIRAAGLYGPVSAERWSGGALPYVENVVRLLVVTGSGQRVSRTEVLRVLCPGGVAMVAGRRIVKPWPKEIDEWPQHHHGADNNAVARDSVVGPPRHFQWIANPVWSRSHLGMASITSMVSAKGRLFSIEDHGSVENPALPGKFFLICRDAFNGVVLWRHRFGDWHPVNIFIKLTPSQLQRQLVAIDDSVYCTPGLNAPITVFDAITGKILKKYDGTEMTQEFVYDKGVLFVVIGDPVDTSSVGGGRFTLGDSAFPAKAYGPRIQHRDDPRCSVVAIDAVSGRRLWQKKGEATRAYQGTSLAVRGSNAVYATLDSLICLDRNSGRERWRAALSKPPRPRGRKKGSSPSAGTGRRGREYLSPGARRNTVKLVLSDEAAYLAVQRSLTAFALKD